MAKVYDSPTANLYALLAEDEQPQTRKEKAVARSKEQEMTPKERAEAKAVQEAERRAKKEAAEKAKKEAEERKKAVEVTDDTGFTQQRHQRIKESRVETRVPAEGSPKNEKPKGQNKQGKNKAGAGKTEKFVKGGDKFEKFDKGGNQEGKGLKEGGKTFKQGGQDNRPARGREFDKHSQGVVSRKPGAKKGGAGKGNWDNAAKSVPTGTTAEEAASSPTLAANDETDTWDNVPDATPTEGEAKPAEGEAATTEGADKKTDEDAAAENEMTLEEYEAIQAKKKEELAAKLGGVAAAQPRALSEEETRALAKFTLVENTKNKKPEAKAVPANASATTRKPAKQPVVLEINVAHPPVRGGRGGRGGRFNGNRGDRGEKGDQNRGEKKGGRVAKPAKLPRGGQFDSQFPSLG